jgi:hypothetical protein
MAAIARLRPAAAGALLALSIGAVCLALQAAVLPRPTSADLLAGRALAEIVRYRAAVSVEHIRGLPPLHAVCLETWIRRRRASLVLLSNGERLSTFGHGVRVAGARRGRRRMAAKEVLLAGCPRIVARAIAGRLAMRHAVVARAADGGYTFRVGRRRARIELDLDPRFRPLALRIPGGSSELRSGAAASEVLRVEDAFGRRVAHE